MKTKDAWQGSFGDAYLQRNRVDWRKRIPFWKSILDNTGIRSAFELGCNAGWNLSALERCDNNLVVWGCDINEKALELAYAAGLGVFNVNDSIARQQFPNTAELTFTVGVLIHIAPKELKETMQKMIDLSSDYVLAVEYESDVETEIEYRGQQDLLWKRPYGELYKRMGLELIQAGDAGKGFDNCTYWLMRK
jgi:pseudaminic acid biosynthesis-associated methylase